MIKSARSGATVVIGIAQTTRRYHTGRLWSLQEGNVGSTIMWVGCSTVRYRPLHNRYVGYTLSCTRSVALNGPVGPLYFSLFIFYYFLSPPPPRPLFHPRPPTYREIKNARPRPVHARSSGRGKFCIDTKSEELGHRCGKTPFGVVM